MDDVRRVIDEDIPEQLSKAMCGGWDMSRSVGESPGEGISKVEGVPGRDAEPLRNLQSGMAWRVEDGGTWEDGFHFPPTATGLSTTCTPYTDRVWRWVWSDMEWQDPGHYELRVFPDDRQRVLPDGIDEEVPVPEFSDPPCDAGPDADGTQRPEQCQRFCSWLNSYTYADCQVFVRHEDGGWACKRVGRKYLCSEEWLTRAEDGIEIPERPKPEEPPDPDDPFIPDDPLDPDNPPFDDPFIPDDPPPDEPPLDDPFKPDDPPFDDPFIPDDPDTPPFDDPFIPDEPEDPDYPDTPPFDDPFIPGEPPDNPPLDDPFIPDEPQYPWWEPDPEDPDIPWLDPVPDPENPDIPWLNPIGDPPSAEEPPAEEPPWWEEIWDWGDPPEPEKPPQETPELPPDLPPELPPQFPPQEPVPPPDDWWWEDVWDWFTPPELPPEPPIEFFNPVSPQPIMRPTGGAHLFAQLIPWELLGLENDPEIDPAQEPEEWVVGEPPEEDDGQDGNEGGEEPEEEAEEEFISEDDFVPNCVPCQGEACRCPGPGCMELMLPERDERMDEPSPMPARDQKIYHSFYRRYESQTEREGVNAAPDDELRSTDMQIACYGFYEEFDPRDHVTAGLPTVTDPGFRARRCSIDWPFTREQLRESQQGVGSLEPQEAGDTEPTARSPGDTPWYPLMGGMSFVRETRTQTTAVTNLGSAFLQPDVAQMEASPQISQTQPMARYGMQRGTDDSVSNETGAARWITRWIQQLQSRLPDVLSPPTVRIRVPASWIRPPDGGNVSSSSDGAEPLDKKGDPRILPVDLQVHAGADIAGTLLRIVDRFFTIQEEPVPMVVPLMSELELEARKIQWWNYVREETLRGEIVPQEVFTLIEKIEEYRQQIGRYRMLRSESLHALNVMLAAREEGRSSMHEWVAQLVERVDAYQQERDRRLDLALLVHDLQRLLTDFADGTNAEWCANRLLTVPVYSLLDPWYPGRPNLQPPFSCEDEEDTLPIICLPLEERDLVIDLPVYLAGPARMRIPVPKPVPVLFAIPHPPENYDEPIDPAALALPDLPEVPAFDATLLQRLSPMQQDGDPPLPDMPEITPVENLEETLDRATRILEGRRDAYAEFTDSLEPPEEGATEEERLTCDGWNAMPCVHVEMDLLERMMRLTALPGVMLREHLEIQGDERHPIGDGRYDCDPADHACLTLHDIEIPQAAGWQVTPASGDASPAEEALEELRVRARRATIDDDGVFVRDYSRDLPVPYVSTPQRVYPVFDIPPDIDLFPDEQ